MNRQVRQWLSEIANRRMHSETRERPLDRFKPEALPHCLSFLTTTATHPKPRFRKISGFASMAIGTAFPIAMLEAAHYQGRLRERYYLQSRRRGRQLCAFMALTRGAEA